MECRLNYDFFFKTTLMNKENQIEYKYTRRSNLHIRHSITW